MRPRQGNYKETVVARYADGPDLVVQLSDDPDATHVEAVLLAEIDERTAVPVPTLVDHGRLAGRAYLVTERVAGADLHERFVALDPDRRQALARRFGEILARLHEAFPFGSAGPVSIDEHGELEAAGRTVEADFTAYAESALEALPGAFDDIRPPLAEALAPPPAPRSPRLFPWDLRPGNALVDDGHLVAVLDWGAPRATDPAMSVAKTEHLVCRWYGTDPAPLRSAFRAGYDAVRTLPEVPVPYWLAAVAASAVDSRGVVTRPHYPERSGADAVAVHRAWLAEWLGTGATE
ncbi:MULTISPECIES: phosphotransferase family protein [Haloarcula]|uniref:phosphotransferase family protein n=1 Tax=Haloarcula TaxID=2237 RepID=UPI0023EAD4E3|nr:phosphotransferase [Halomicroarcula sp. XH51]